MKKIFILLLFLLSLTSLSARKSHKLKGNVSHSKQNTNQFFTAISIEGAIDNLTFAYDIGYTHKLKKYSISTSISNSFDINKTLGSYFGFDFWKNDSPFTFGVCYSNSYDFINKSNENWLSFNPGFNKKMNDSFSLFLCSGANFKLEKSNFDYLISYGVGIDYVISKKFSFGCSLNNQSNAEKIFYPSIGISINYN